MIDDCQRLTCVKRIFFIILQMSDYIRPIGTCFLPSIGGILGGFVTKNNMKTWYEVGRNLIFKCFIHVVIIYSKLYLKKNCCF